MKPGWILGFAVTCFAAICHGPATAKTVLKFNALLSEDSELGQASLMLAKRTRELTNGEVEIQMFFSGQLGKNIPVVLQSLMAGDLDGFVESGNYFGSLDKRFNVLDAPYVFKSRQQFENFLKSEHFRDMAKAINERGIKIVNGDKMNWFRSEDRAILAKKPIFTPQDLRTLKIRQYQAEMPIRGVMALGANVQVVAWPDVYTALTTGTVDGLETVLSQSVQTKHVEVAKFHTILKLYFQTAYPMMSRKAWERLSPAQQAAISQAATEAGEHYTALSTKVRDQFVEIATRDYGVTIITPPLAPFQKLMGPAHDEWIAKGMLPKETMEAVAKLPH